MDYGIDMLISFDNKWKPNKHRQTHTHTYTHTHTHTHTSAEKLDTLRNRFETKMDKGYSTFIIEMHILHLNRTPMC